METIRALIVDDESLGRERVRALLGRHADVSVAGECAGGPEAVEAIRTHHPDLVFLDVQMPELDGFGVIRAIGATRMPAVIFVTAYDEHALDAFEVHAIDYLLKPIDIDRFDVALDRARRLVHSAALGAAEARLHRLLNDVAPRRPLERVLVKARSKTYFVRLDTVDWIEAAGNYVRLHAEGRQHLVRITMGALEERLDPSLFMRIHRSAIVNLDRVRELIPTDNGESTVVLTDGTTLTLSRGYRDRLESFKH
ncbi:MAG: LytTR family DNA-binding domain-containing protein [Rhodothermales bacterium]